MKSTVRAAVLLAVLLGVALVLGGCAPRKTNPAALEGSWKLESFGGPTNLVLADPAVHTEMTLQSWQAAGNGGVNSFSGPYTASSDAKCSFGPMAATAMAGPPAAMAQESKFFAALDKSKRWEINQGKLVLGDIGNDTTLVFVRK